MPPSTVKLAHLRHLLTLIGRPTTGTKPELHTRLEQEISIPRFPVPYGRRKKTNTLRVLSLDMGIRNLAYAVCDVKLDSPSGKRANMSEGIIEKPGGIDITVADWTRIDLTTQSTSSPPSSAPSVETEPTTPSSLGPYHPSLLAQTAHNLLFQRLLPLKPDVILLERQRYRSANQAAVQEWTLRVNMLEGMIWACYTTLQNITETLEEDIPIMEGVSPRTVTKFWLDGVDDDPIEASSPSSSKKASSRSFGVLPVVVDTSPASEPVTGRKRQTSTEVKKLKIALAASWLMATNQPADGPSIHNPSPHSPPTLSFSESAARTRSQFLERLHITGRGAKRPVSSSTIKVQPNQIEDAAMDEEKDAEEDAEEEDTELVVTTSKTAITKVDDLADCLLQAVAWMQWERNREWIHIIGIDDAAKTLYPTQIQPGSKWKRSLWKSRARERR